MKLILILNLFSSIGFCSSFKWNSVEYVHENETYRGLIYGSTADGSIHLFRTKDNIQFIHRVLLPNGSLTEGLVTEVEVDNHVYTIDLLISEDGEHIIYVFLEENSKISTLETLYVSYIESTNGGLSWSKLKPINETLEHKSFVFDVSGYIDNKTGRIYILSCKTMIEESIPYIGLALNIREPGEASFEKEIRLPRLALGDPNWIKFGTTTDSKSTKQYLHAFVKTTSHELMYSRSIDNGLTWSKFIKIMTEISSLDKSNVVINNDAIEGGLYVQTENGHNLISLRWSNDHGVTWKDSIKVERRRYSQLDACICGDKKRGIFLSAYTNSHNKEGFIKFASLKEKVSGPINLPYPLKRFHKQKLIHCSYVEKEHYSITYIAQDNYDDRTLHIARGFLKGV